MDWIHLAQNRVQWQALVNSNEPSGSIKCWEILEQPSEWWFLMKDSALYS
jgi:hypothetical protein